TTVEVTGAGSGGRNQEAALAAAMAVEGGEILFMAAGTDGVDGPTDAAGGLVDGSTIGLIETAGCDPAAALANNDSHHALEAGGALIRTGPTGTNVADLWIVDRT
ncbi:MAG: MOFRL family protein, partial [Acidimicrobiia bacterium]